MQLTGGVDFFTSMGATGWVADRDAPGARLAVDIRVNGRQIARVPASGFRDDLLAAGWGDGKKAFWFNPMDFLSPGENRFEVVFAGTQTLLPNGATTIVDAVHEPTRAAADELLSRSKTRWGGAEPDAGLTWGRPMTGDSFFDAVVQHLGTTDLAGLSLLEVGPGYGRLLKTLRQRGYGCKSYVGLELSADRVQRLTSELGDPATRFVCGDAMRSVAGSGFDLCICSATFEHFYPDCAQALLNIRGQMSAGGRLCIDFKQYEPDMLFSCGSFESNGGAFVRIYSRAELEGLFAKCGLVVEGISSITLGTGETGVIQRIFVCARVGGGAGPG
jgi:SAM-dependent methyltransferase